MAQSSVNQRFTTLLDYLISEKLVYNQSDLARELGIARSQITAIKNGYGDVSKQIVQKLEDVFPTVSTSWLLTGEGSMLVADSRALQPTEFTTDQIEQATALADKLGIDLIPMYSEPFRAGNEGYNVITAWNEVESVWTLPDIKADMIIPVFGDSMRPTFPQGARLAVSHFNFRLDEPLAIPFGEVFAVVVHDPDDPEESITTYLKRLYRHPDHDKCRTHWIARSDNDIYEDFEVPIAHVSALWRVRACISYIA